MSFINSCCLATCKKKKKNSSTFSDWHSKAPYKHWIAEWDSGNDINPLKTHLRPVEIESICRRQLVSLWSIYTWRGYYRSITQSPVWTQIKRNNLREAGKRCKQVTMIIQPWPLRCTAGTFISFKWLGPEFLIDNKPSLYQNSP